MAKGRKPAPTALKIVRGNPGRRPINEREPKPKSALPTPPPHLSDDATKEWKRLAKEMAAIGMLTGLDMAAFGAYCQAFGRWVAAERIIAKMAASDPVTEGLLIKTTNGNAIQNPVVGTANKAAADMVRYAAEFGLTPSSRSRLSIDAPKIEDEWDSMGRAS